MMTEQKSDTKYVPVEDYEKLKAQNAKLIETLSTRAEREQEHLSELANELESVKAQAAAIRKAAQDYLVGPCREEFDPVTGLACACCGADIHEDGSGHDKGCPVGVALATDAGKGYVPADKARVIAEALNDCYPFVHNFQSPKMREGLVIAHQFGLLEDAKP